MAVVSDSGVLLPSWEKVIDTECRPAKVPPYNGNDPRPPLVA